MADPDLIRACKLWDKITEKMHNEEYEMPEELNHAGENRPYSSGDYIPLQCKITGKKAELTVGSSTGHKAKVDLESGKLQYFDNDSDPNQVMSDLLEEAEYHRKRFQEKWNKDSEFTQHRKDYYKNWIAEHKDKKTGYNQKYRNKHPPTAETRERNATKMRKYRLTHPEHREKQRVRLVAWRNIPIPKDQMCQDCHERLATQRHHPDYAKPLEVYFLCDGCHAKRESGKNQNCQKVQS